jgi:aconitate hydratase
MKVLKRSGHPNRESSVLNSTPHVWLSIRQNLPEPEHHIIGPFTPDLATRISKLASAAKKNGWLEEIMVGLIGSCTNSSYEDKSRGASLVKQT